MSILRSSKQRFLWAPFQDDSFIRIKKAFTNNDFIALPNYEKRCYVSSVASIKSLGTTLEQEDNNGKLRPVAFYSRKLSEADKARTIFEIELVALYNSMKYLLVPSKRIYY